MLKYLSEQCKRFAELAKIDGFWATLFKAIKLLIKRVAKRFYNIYLTLRGRFSDDVIRDPLQVIMVPTEKIEYKLQTPPERKGEARFRLNRFGLRFAGLIWSGDWDKKGEKFTNLLVYKAFYERFVEKKEWDQTEYYNLFQSRKKIRGCDSWTQFKTRHLEKWDKLYETIKTNGYVDHAKRGKPPTDEIEVAVARDGEILFVDGRHRLATAKILNLPEVPVIVNIWHKDFIEYVKKETGDKKITPAVAMRYAKL